MSEKLEAARDGARLHRNSGRGKHQKGDATLGPFCVDYKEYSETFGMSRGMWAKVQKDALTNRQLPALKLILGDDEVGKTRLWVISDNMFHEMLEAWEQKYGEQG